MRIWSIHPQYLDTKGLLALWRETLLAKAVLKGETRGYQNHPQLKRFKELPGPSEAINAYLAEVWNEAGARKFVFDKAKVDWTFKPVLIPVKEGQVKFEVQHLLNKLEKRDHQKYKQLMDTGSVKLHPVFEMVSGGIESWEKIQV
jgi:hypothetical protein